MSVKKSMIPKENIIEETNQSVGTYNYAFSGTSHRRWTLQLKMKNVSIKIYCSNRKQPGANGWTDVTSMFSPTGSDTIATDAMIFQSNDIKVLWWKIQYSVVDVSNYIVANLLLYDQFKK